MKRIATLVVLLPVAIVLLLFAVANRAPVTLSLDPFNAAAPALAVRVPLFLVLFATLMLGVLVGGLASWLQQGRVRRSARRARAEAERQRVEIDRLRGEMAGTEPPVRAGLPATIPF